MIPLPNDMMQQDTVYVSNEIVAHKQVCFALFLFGRG